MTLTAFPPSSSERLMSIMLALSQYPVMAGRIRARMRRELFEREIILPQEFEGRVRETAIRSQEREGLHDPFAEESLETWDVRVTHVRDHMTDVIFSQNLSFELFQHMVNDVLGERGVDQRDLLLSMNPELAPQDMVFEQAMTIERMEPRQRAQYEARLRESKVVLIRTMISDQLRYVNIAKEWYTISDLADIRRRKIGSGRIGGKAAGMLLAYRILSASGNDELLTCLHTPESFYVGSDEMYTFMTINNLFHWNDQKYKSEDEMRAEYPQIVADFEAGSFPPDILDKLTTMLVNIGQKPVIVRSSSLLEDNFGTSFAGKYESIFCPNQGSLQDNLKALTRAIARIYASTLNPNALLYRRSRGLQDYDERMAILVQVVQGQKYGHYFLPTGAGVAFSRNLYRWAPQIRREDGFVRLVWGLGTRAVDRVGNDYPRLIALSHPLLRPNNDPKAIRRYSQQYVDLIDLEDNSFKTLPVSEVMKSDYAPLRYLVQVDEDGYFVSLRSRVVDGDPRQLVLTFEDFLRRTPFAEKMRELLHLLERTYRAPVDMEFTVTIRDMESSQPQICLTILQCRPQAHLMDTEEIVIPSALQNSDLLFRTHFMVPEGKVERVKYVVYVNPEAYFSLPTTHERAELARTIGHLNAALEKEQFICVGPGRWGSSNSDLGVPIDYGDIYHSQSLVELAGQGYGLPPEPSLGTHFFQDLLEAQIYPLAVYLDDPKSFFNQEFFAKTANHLREWIQTSDKMENCLKLIRVEDYRPDHHLRLVMSDTRSLGLGYFEKDF